jgi:hypothetical protein
LSKDERRYSVWVVPAYCRSRQGRVFRVLRSSEPLDADRVRYRLRAVPVGRDGDHDGGREVSREFDAALLLDKVRHGQAIPTPEETFEELWRQLQIDLDLGYG